MCRVRLRHLNKIGKCTFFVVPDDSLALLGIPDTELLNIQIITCEVMGDQQADGKFDAQAIQPIQQA